MATNTTATTQTHNGTGSQANFAISFSFLADSEVDVTVGGVLKTLGTHYTISGSTLTFTSGNIPPSGTGNIKFTRDTNISTKKVDFTDGSVLTETDLDTNADQILFAQQEITDKLSGIEENATADQTNVEIKTAYEANSDTNAFTDALQSKLNAIESGATADQTNVEIKTAYEANSDTNAFTDAEKTKLSGIETSADVTDTTNVDAAGAVMNTDTSTSAMNFVVDEDNMSSNSDTKVPTQQSVKAYVDANSGGGGAVDSVSGSAPIVSSGGTTPAISITAATTSAAGSMSSTDKTKLDAIEANADVTDATNVDAAGAVMNSDLDGKGELLVGDGSGDPTALAVGTDGYVLKANSSTATGIEWAAAGAGGDVNQNAFSTIAVSGQSNVAADSTTDTLNIAAGTNVTITTDPSTDTVTITSTDTNTTYSVGDGGLTQNNFTDALKTKLDGIAANANVGLTDVVSDSSPQLGASLDVQAFEIITATTNGNIKLTADGTGFVEVKGNTNAGTIQLNCESNSHGVKLQSPAHSAAQSYTLILPDNQVAADKFLKVKSISGSGATATGQLEFADASGGGSSIGGDTGVDFNDDVSVRFGSSNDASIKYVSSTDALTISNTTGSLYKFILDLDGTEFLFTKYYLKFDKILDIAGGTGRLRGVGAGTCIAILRETKSHSSYGGDFISGTDQVRVLNTEEGLQNDSAEDVDFCTLNTGTGEFTLDAGTYLVYFSAPAYDVNMHAAKIVTDDGTDVLYGMNSHSGSSDNTQTHSTGFGIITTASSEGYFLKHRCVTSKYSTGLGLSRPTPPYSGETGSFSIVVIWRLK